nr:uncharacterized protein CTRU02_05916 [Colletotrichum truncatum]KAF6793661.1 hypothetical protein CTRU02_05916 [Colletotrichum truncatum]
MAEEKKHSMRFSSPEKRGFSAAHLTGEHPARRRSHLGGRWRNQPYGRRQLSVVRN